LAGKNVSKMTYFVSSGTYNFNSINQSINVTLTFENQACVCVCLCDAGVLLMRRMLQRLFGIVLVRCWLRRNFRLSVGEYLLHVLKPFLYSRLYWHPFGMMIYVLILALYKLFVCVFTWLLFSLFLLYFLLSLCLFFIYFFTSLFPDLSIYFF